MTELVNLFWSAAGVFPGEAEVSPFDFEARVKSAARAGFKGISFWHADLAAILERRTLAEVRSILDDYSVAAWEVAFIEDWFTAGEQKSEADRRRDFVIESAAELGAHHVKAGDRRNTPCDRERLPEAFAALCAAAGRAGQVVGFEFMRSSMIHQLDDCLWMVEQSGAPNGGLIVDIAHTNAIGISNEAVAQLPAEQIISVELSDNLRAGAPGYDATSRRFCGDGELNVAGFIAAARTAGYRGPWAVEVINTAHRGWSLDRLNETGFQTTMAALE